MFYYCPKGVQRIFQYYAFASALFFSILLFLPLAPPSLSLCLVNTLLFFLYYLRLLFLISSITLFLFSYPPFFCPTPRFLSLPFFFLAPSLPPPHSPSLPPPWRCHGRLGISGRSHKSERAARRTCEYCPIKNTAGEKTKSGEL